MRVRLAITMLVMATIFGLGLKHRPPIVVAIATAIFAMIAYGNELGDLLLDKRFREQELRNAKRGSTRAWDGWKKCAIDADTRRRKIQDLEEEIESLEKDKIYLLDERKALRANLDEILNIAGVCPSPKVKDPNPPPTKDDQLSDPKADVPR